MKSLLTATVAALSVLIQAACTSPPETPTLKLPYFAKTDCELVYKSRGTQVVENFCETQWKPVKIFIQDQKYSIHWIDEKTSRHVFDSGCGKTGACYYELKMDGLTVNGRFVYTTELIQGDFTFEVDANENVKMLGQTTNLLSS